MDRRQIGLKLVLEALGLEAKLGTFDDRLILQKAIYLAQEAGANLGYFFRWYLYGPYCPALTKDAFAVEEDMAAGFDDAEGWILGSDLQEALEKVKPPLAADPASRRRKLELLASVHFLLTRKQVTSERPADICEVLQRYSKDFTQEEVEQALNTLRNHGLLK